MRNKIVGFLVIGIAALIGWIIYIFNHALTNIVNDSCTHGPTCPMWGTINFETSLSLGVMIIVAVVGLYLIFFGTEEKIITRIKRIREQVQPKKLGIAHYQKVMTAMDPLEKSVFKKLIDSQGSIMQSDLLDGVSLTKVKVTRILDKLEGKGLIERKRRGMTNIVLLK